MAGGKLTGYRKMAQSVVDLIVEDFRQEKGVLYSDSETLHLPVSGGDVGGAKGFKHFRQSKINEGTALGLTQAEAEKMVNLYGSNIDKILSLFIELENEAMEAGLEPLVFAQLRYAIEEEMTYKPVDFFVRRTSALFFNIEGVRQNKDNAIRYLAKVLHWYAEQTEQYQAELNQLLFEAVHPIS